MMRLSEHATFADMDNINDVDGEPARQDIGANNAQTDYVSMKDYSRAVFFLVLGTWNATDDLDTAKIQQYDGTTTKDLTTSGSGSNYDTDTPLDADGDFMVIEIRAEDLDVDNGFNQVRGYVAEVTGTGTDNVAAWATRYGYAYPQKELQGAASASQVYVDPGT